MFRRKYRNKKRTTGVDLILDNLTLTSSATAPITIKKDGASATIQLVGTSTITDSENPDNETSTDTTVADAFEGAAIKVKSSSSLIIEGSGTLNVDGSSCKNGIKGAATSSITINSGTINVNAANNGIACDGTLTINDGTISVTSSGDGIKSEPDSDDTTSAGAVAINGGTITVNAEGDGIQATNNLTITDGEFNIKTLNGYNSSSFNSSTMSCKGLKASTNEQEDIESVMTISGGTFYINTADDAIHSDDYVTITGGTFQIYTGDDGVHADTSLVLGSENGLERDPYITIYKSYEGLEAGNVYIYSGKYYIISTDDGINAAGGSSNGSDPGTGGGNTFNPGGGPGGPGSSRPGETSQGGQGTGSSSSNGDYAIYIYGGTIYINVEGDGLDSNGDIYIYGGTTEVWGMKSGGDNEPIDHDGKLIIQNATVFAGGTKGMEYVHSGITSTNQGYKYATTSYSNGTSIYVKNSNTVVCNTTVPKSINYLFYTSPSITTSNTSSYSFATSGSATCSTGNAWSHSWNDGVITTEATANSSGVITYTCSTCGKTERQTVTYKSLSEATEIEIDNKTAENAEVTFENGALTVTCNSACVVLVKNDDGETYSRISAISTNNENAYNFSLGTDSNTQIIVALKGDVDLNGTVNTADTMLINRSRLSSSASAYLALSSELQKMIADVDGDGSVNLADTMLINRSRLSSSSSAYSALTWE